MLAECECSREGKGDELPSKLYIAPAQAANPTARDENWRLGGRNVAIDDRLHVGGGYLLFVKTQNECRSELTTYGCLGGTPNTW